VTEYEAVLMRLGGDNPPTLTEELRARACMWRGAVPPMMREHARYIDAAADRIEELEAAIFDMDDQHCIDGEVACSDRLEVQVYNPNRIVIVDRPSRNNRSIT
jgi:hypothetical protein